MIIATVAGNLGADAEIKDAGNGKVLRFRVASSTKRGQSESTTWVGCSWFGKRAMAVAEHLSKGKQVVVAGELSTTEKDGKTYVNLDVNSLKLMGGAPGGGGGRRPDTPRELENTKENVDGDEDSGLPF